MGCLLLLDNFGRPLTNLRISITGECNYNCVFCHREGGGWEPGALTIEEIELVSTAAYELGIKNFKLTGGEPLIRKDLPEIIRRLKSMGGDVEVSLTSNGYFLKERAEELWKAGLDRVNVSLHALRPEVYYSVTRSKGEKRVLDGLRTLKNIGMITKLNFVLTKLNKEEIPGLLDFASSMEFNVNIIELIPSGRGEELFNELYVPVEEVLPLVASRALKRDHRELHNRPVFTLENGLKVEIVANYCNPSFCAKCERIRLTQDGRLKPCLNRDDYLDLKSILRDEKLSKEEKLELLKKAIETTNLRRRPYFVVVNGKCMSIDGKFLCEKPRAI